MATLEDVLRIQKQDHILQAPMVPSDGRQGAKFSVLATTKPTTQIALKNNTTAPNLYATLTGLDINKQNKVWMLRADGKSGYWPDQPGQDQQPVQADVVINIGGPGATKVVTVPWVVGGRIYFSMDKPLTFKLNRGGNGAALVEPSVTNPSDPNYNLYWDFAEFTYNDFQLFANITYVDFVSIPHALKLESDNGAVQRVLGMPTNGLDMVCRDLVDQQNREGAPWGSLVVKHPSTKANLRALAPYQAIVMNRSLFSNYYTAYVDKCWSKYASSNLTVNTQVQWGKVAGRVSGNNMNFAGYASIPKPSAADIFSCNTGAFTGYPGNIWDQMSNLGARLGAALNRGTLLDNPNQPDGENPSKYYKTNPCNHYSRIVHANNLDQRGYGFAYDDVVPTNGSDQAGTVASQTPKLMTLYIGGGLTSNGRIKLREMATPGRQNVAGRRVRRGLEDYSGASADEEKAALAARDAYDDAANHAEFHGYDSDAEEEQVPLVHVRRAAADLDLEAGRPSGKLAELHPQLPPYEPAASGALSRSMRSVLPESVLDRATAWVERLEASPVYGRVRPVVDAIVRIVAAVLSLSVRAFVSRVAMLLFMLLFYLLMGPLNGGHAAGAPGAEKSMVEQVHAAIGVDPVQLS